MSIARAFTTRRGKLSTDLGFGGGDNSKSSPNRNNSTRNIRNQISGPVQLVHTTNMLSYNAPDLPRSAMHSQSHSLSQSHGMSHIRSGSSSPRRSEDDSSTVRTSDSTPPTSPDVAPGEPMHNHLSTYFMTPGKPLAGAPPQAAHAPSIPARSPSHTKKASYGVISRQRSASNMSKSSDLSVSTKGSATFSRSSSTSTNTTSTSHLSASNSMKLSAPPIPSPLSPYTPPHSANKEHPFGHELAQVTELVEELGDARNTKALREDDEYIRSKGLTKMTAADYLQEIDNLAATFFPEVSRMRAAGPLWI
ncbi:hypothetical protein B0I35DRAFT_404243 [Stachybotrys elegans]|uniref:Uncharacterized protein n=1 Tax=Stachybotrys elegans TaxID=80388 RepID=A0A8K0SZG6_9HYPO|nr:hypothetical protein B0I35DRAFT_404243 [Stachybotrys elegans]